MANPENLIGKGFDKNPQNINRQGRKPSLKKQLAKVALSDGWLTFEAKDVEVLGDGRVKVKVPKEEAMALKMFQIAMGKNPNAAMSAIKVYLETFDGKATQKNEHSGLDGKAIKVINIGKGVKPIE